MPFFHTNEDHATCKHQLVENLAAENFAQFPYGFLRELYIVAIYRNIAEYFVFAAKLSKKVLTSLCREMIALKKKPEAAKKKLCIRELEPYRTIMERFVFTS